MDGNEDQREFEGNELPATPPEASDLIDFHLRWRQFRPFAMRAMESASNQADRQTIEWLITLADRVSQNDLEEDG